MKISIEKKYRTRGGQSVRVICTDRDAPYPVVALIGTNSFVETFTSDGGCLSSSTHPNDLIEVREWSDFKIDEPVMAKNKCADEWQSRHFAGINAEGKPTTWHNGRTSWSYGGTGLGRVPSSNKGGENRMKISMDKKYRTQDGQSVRLLCVDRGYGRNRSSVVALVGEAEYLESYTKEGRASVMHPSPTDLVEVREWDDFKIDEPVIVRRKGGSWIHGCFAGVLDTGKPLIWVNGRVSWTEIGRENWDECRRPTKEELER